MKHILLGFCLVLFMIGCGEDPVAPVYTDAAIGEYLVVDHAAVTNYTRIPQFYIDKVKCMWVSLAGESHSSGYRIGMQMLEDQDARFAVSIVDSGEPEPFTTANLRFSRGTRKLYSWDYNYGEADFFTSAAAITQTLTNLQYCNTVGPIQDVFGFGWCWDMTWQNDIGGGTNAQWQVRWAGSSEGGPDGSQRWGLTDADYGLTGNRVSMQTYLNAVDLYREYCRTNNYATRVIFTTGPVDGGENEGERGYQRFAKHQYIRAHVVQNKGGRILFDYADILCHNDAGEQHLTGWTDHAGTPVQFPSIHPDNMLDDTAGNYSEDGDHIGRRGALRLAKAMWWMLARLAGWDGTSP